MNKFTKLTLKVLLWTIGVIVGLVLLIFILISIPAVQNYAVQKVVHYLETKIGTTVKLERVSLDLPKVLVLEGVYFEDQKQDTLFAGDFLKVNISLLKLLKNKVEINELNFQGITAHVKRSLPDSSYNFDYIIRAFVNEQAQTKPNDTTAAMAFSMDRINLNRIKIIYNDEIIGTSAHLNLGHLDTRIKTFDLNKMFFEVPKITIDGFTTVVKQWEVAVVDDIPSTTALGVENVVDEDQPTDLRIGKLDLKNFNIQYDDAMAEMEANLIFNSLLLDFNELNLPKENIDINAISLDGANAAVTFAKKQETKKDTSSDSGPINWVVKAKSIDLKDNHIVYDDNNFSRLRKGMDYSHLDLNNLNLNLRNFFFSMDSIRGEINTLTLKEKSGLEVKKLQTLFTYTDRGASLNDLYLETPNSLVQNNLIVTYPSVENIVDHPENITIDASIVNSKLGMKDIVLLVPDLDTMQVMQPLLSNTFLVDGKIKGRVDNLAIPNLRVSTLAHTRIDISGYLKGLPNMDRLQLDLNLKDFTSTNGEFARLIDKSLLPDSLALPEIIHLSGMFKGGTSNFSTKLNLKSSIGDADIDGEVLLGKVDTLYDAKINIENFDLGKLMSDTTYGAVSFSADVKGKSFDPKKAIADVEANLISASFMGYTYSDVHLDAQANSGDIVAHLISNDPNLKVNGDLKADMRGQYPIVKFSMFVDSVNLKNLQFTKDEIKYHGQIEGDFLTADPDFLNGYLFIVNSMLSYNGNVYPVDSISLTAEASDSLSLINLESEFMNAHIVGKYKLTELSAAVQDALGRYYNPEQTVFTKTYSPQSFEFSAELIRSPLIRNLLPELTEMSSISLDGNFSSENQTINARLAAPHILYNDMLIDTVVFDLNTADTTIYYAGRIGEIKVSSVQVINTLISGTVKDNLLDFGLWIKDSIEREQYHLGVNILAERKDFILSLQPDGLILNYDKWQIEPGNQIHFGQTGIIANNFVLSNEGQFFSLNSQDSTFNSPLDVKFTDFRIETFTRFLETNTLKVGGGITGTVLVDRLESNPTFVTDLTVNQFYFGNDTIGDINMQVDNKRENVYAVNVAIEGEGNDVSLKGDFFNPPSGNSSLDFVLNLNTLNMSTLEAFSLGYLQHSSGLVHGQLTIKGETKSPLVNGDLLFDKAQTNISMLNALFRFDQQIINFNKEGLRFNKFEVADSTGNKAILNGTVQTKTYTDFLLDLSLNATNFQVVNSTAKDNDLFYGKLFVTSNLRIRGTATNPKVDGTIRANENTNFTIVIPDENPGLIDREGIVEFIDKRNENRMQVFTQKDTVITPRVTGMDISFNIEVDPKATFNIIIDPGSGDAVSAKGKAQLTAGIDPSGKMTLAGTYEVSEGSYNLSFNFLNRRFDFRKGSTITWTGDPLTADLNITADYLINAPSIDLVENQLSDQNKNLYKEKLPFQVNLFIKGEMMKPQLTFGIDVDEERASVSQDVMTLVNTRLAQISEDESELNKQVFALIVLGRFVAENPFSSSAGGSVESMARESVSKLLSAQLNRLAGDLIAGVELDFDLESVDDYSTGNLRSRTDLNVGISKRLLDDRLKVTIGSNFELEGANQPGRQPTNIAGDIAIDYQLSRDGRYLLRAYRKNQYEVTLQGQVVETGVGFIITLDYDDYRELFLGTKALERYKRRKERRERRKYLDKQTLENERRIRRNQRQGLRNKEANNEE